MGETNDQNGDIVEIINESPVLPDGQAFGFEDTEDFNVSLLNEFSSIV